MQKYYFCLWISYGILPSVDANNCSQYYQKFSLLVFFDIKLGHYITNAFFSHVTNIQASQQKFENRRKTKFARIDSRNVGTIWKKFVK